MSETMESIAYLPIEDVLPQIGEDCQIVVKGVVSRASSLRLHTFKHKGTDCVVCGCVGAYFSIERQRWANKKKDRPYTGGYHMNLYGVMPDGTVRLMTHDHIIPRSKYGADTLENSITMCEKCNFKKGSDVPGWPFVLLHGCEVVPHVHKQKENHVQKQANHI